MLIIELEGDLMKILFQRRGSKVDFVDLTSQIISIDGKCVNELGEEIQVEEKLYKRESLDDYQKDDWYEAWMDYEGLDEPLKSESVVEPICEIDDMFGQYGFKNKAGEFVIEPQYAYAYEFTNGLAAVNLGRTWYCTEEGKRYYEYGDRFLEFSYEQRTGEETVGIYDTKERKIIIEPSLSSIIELGEECILVDVRDGEYGESDFHQYYVNSKGEIVYPWLYGKGFAIVRQPDVNNVAAVATSKYTELTGNPRSYFSHNGKKYDRKFEYGLYSSKGKYIILPEYEKIEQMRDNIWICYKDGEILVVETEKGD